MTTLMTHDVTSPPFRPPARPLVAHRLPRALSGKNVFGFDHKTDRQGKPIEQGVGSPGNQSRNSIEACKKYCSHEPDFERNLARMHRFVTLFDKNGVCVAAFKQPDAPVK
jgi:hypothetical protein